MDSIDRADAEDRNGSDASLETNPAAFAAPVVSVESDDYVSAIVGLQVAARRLLDSARVIITALALAFVFRAFFVEPFIIPTGSMAPTLLGDHWSVVCPSCGYTFDTVQRLSPDESENISIRCGNCREFFVPPAAGLTRKPGDRILVHKWIDSLVPPKRWEVCVFRDPSSPLQHYIKRIVGLPQERIEIIDGDVYINDVIVRKPAWVQQALWQPVYAQEFPELARSMKFSRWIEAGAVRDQGRWSGLDESVLRFAGQPGQSGSLQFIADAGEYCFDYSAYNGTSDGNRVHDVKVSTGIQWEDQVARCAFSLRLANASVHCTFSASGRITVEIQTDRTREATEAHTFENVYDFDSRVPVCVELFHLEQKFVLQCNNRTIFETGDEFGFARAADRRGKPSEQFRLEIRGSEGPFSLNQFRLHRDVYYTESRMAVRAVRGEPFSLERGEYFALGDNSADSKDSREWLEYGPHLPSGYRLGTIPRSKIVGKAAFVYLPGLQKGFAGSIRMSDIGRGRFIR
ncbi:MAG: signal peptidase I [Phycisphaerae bacterium]